MKFNIQSAPLPTKRKDLLKDILRYRFFDCVFVSIYCLCFLFPAVIWLIFVNYTFLSENNIFNTLLVYAVLIPLLMIFGLGIGGGLYFFKRLVWSEGTNVHSDFFIGLQKNAKKFLGIFFFIGVAYMLLHVNLTLIYNYAEWTMTIKGILSGLSYVAFFLIMMVLYFMQTQTIIYQASWRQLFSNGLKFTFGKIAKNLVIFFIIGLPFFIFEFVPFSIAEWMSIMGSGLFYFGFSLLVFTLYSHSIFDKTINVGRYEEIIRKGLAHEDNSGSNIRE